MKKFSRNLCLSLSLMALSILALPVNKTVYAAHLNPRMYMALSIKKASSSWDAFLAYTSRYKDTWKGYDGYSDIHIEEPTYAYVGDELEFEYQSLYKTSEGEYKAYPEDVISYMKIVNVDTSEDASDCTTKKLYDTNKKSEELDGNKILFKTIEDYDQHGLENITFTKPGTYKIYFGARTKLDDDFKHHSIRFSEVQYVKVIVKNR